MNKYQIIYADPPWSYYNDMTVNPDVTTVKGMRRPPYPVMSTKDICNINVNDISDVNSILFIWTTDCHLEKCMKVINSWGFTYKTVGFVWRKTSPKTGKGVSFMGAYTKKSGVELCLLATKGKDAHKLVKNHKVESFLEYPRYEHSKKPDIIRDRITDLVGDVKKIELFARIKPEGWDVWGNEVNNDITLGGINEV